MSANLIRLEHDRSTGVWYAWTDVEHDGKPLRVGAYCEDSEEAVARVRRQLREMFGT